MRTGKSAWSRVDQRNAVILAGEVLLIATFLTGLAGFILSIPSGFSLLIGYYGAITGFIAALGAIVAVVAVAFFFTMLSEHVRKRVYAIAAAGGAVLATTLLLVGSALDVQGKLTVPAIMCVAFAFVGLGLHTKIESIRNRGDHLTTNH